MTTSLTLVHAASAFLASLPDGAPDPADVKPGWIALGVFVLLFVATILLWLSMRRQLGKISFDDGVDRSAPDTRIPGVPQDQPAAE